MIKLRLILLNAYILLHIILVESNFHVRNRSICQLYRKLFALSYSVYDIDIDFGYFNVNAHVWLYHI